MGHIIPKLNLNKTPQSTESNSLVFAKNIKVNQDGSLGRDNAISLIRNLATLGGQDDYNEYLGHIVGVNGCIYFFVKKYRDNAEFGDFIYEYDEVNLNSNGDPKFVLIPCGWHWSGGKITGCVTTNNTNQKILTVSEYFDDNENNVLVPLKHINLSECKQNDDESIYTQNPNIPITNLHFAGYYNCTIPNGVYQFFVRYKVRDGFYTNWFPASKELYAGVSKTTRTVQGSLKYVDLDKDCPNSFVLDVEHLCPVYKKNFVEFQIGFIVSSGNASVARSWKSFDLNISTIYFDYDKNFIKEQLIDDLLETPYEIFNARNVINYKNKLYISNYVESDLNPVFDTSNIDITLLLANIEDTGNDDYVINGCTLTSTNDAWYYDKIFIDNSATNINEIFSNEDFSVIDLSNINDSNTFNTDLMRHYYNADKWYVKYVKIRYRKDGVENSAYVVNKSDGGFPDTSTTDYIAFTTNFAYIDDFKLILDKYVSSDIIGIGVVDGKYYYTNLDLNVNAAEILDVEVKIQHIVETWEEDDPDSQTPSHAELNKLTRTIKGSITPKYVQTTYKQEYQTNTLLPFTDYNFYIHFVKSNGVVTNGSYICTKSYNYIQRDITEIHSKYIYPKIENVEIPDGYTSYFISIVKVKNNVVQFFNIKNNKADCLELDTLIYPEQSLKLLKLSTNNNRPQDYTIVTGKYYGSNENTMLAYFGDCGNVLPLSNDSITDYGIFHYDIRDNKYFDLIKLTPYLIAKDYDEPYDLNAPGYVCKVTKLDHTKTFGSPTDTPPINPLYVSGFDIFSKTITANGIQLDEIENIVPIHQTVLYRNSLSYGEYEYILSEFNFNFLTLRENLNKGFRSWNKRTETTNTEDSSITTEKLEKQWIISVNSQNCSLIYDLPLMYKEYTRKYYSVVDDKTFIVFNNTVRSSNVDIDEVFRSIYKFDAEDYYNVPTNRGIIVNLFSINNEIFVHTEHGLFKFTDSSLLKVGDNLYSSNKEIGVSESSPFEIGIAEIVDSQYGHGGLQNKEHALITFNGYIFYDSLVRNIYSYDNQSGIQNITPPVRKIIDWFEPTDVTFVSDDANSRFFITFSKSFGNNKLVICLSYSFISKSFVSIHDINYDYAFNSRLNTYFIKNDNLLKINYKDFGYYFNRWPSVLHVPDEVNFIEDSIGSCIDIVVNDNYEIIKYLSHIHWICSNINNYVGENPYNVAEELISNYGGDSIRIYSDQTWSDLLPIDTEQNSQQINSANSYQYPRYNNGIWTMNYFRDIKNADSNYVSDDMSLIHGKYIVVRFIFGANKKNFKFENLNINFKNYEKV